MIKFIVQILFLFAPVLAIGQHHLNAKRVDLGTTKNFPMRNGSVSFIDPGCSFYGCRMSGVDIESKNDSVFSNCSGEVCAVFGIGTEESVILRNDNNIFYSFLQMDSVTVNKGDKVDKGTYLGKPRQNEDSNKLYSIIYMVSDKVAKNLSEKKIWELLDKSNQSVCTNEKIAYQ